MDRINQIYAELGSHYSAIKSLTRELKNLDVSTNPMLNSYDIGAVVCDYFEIDMGDVYKKCRKSEYAVTRHIIRKFLNEYTPMTLNQIAKATGAKDHTTVINSLRIVKKQLFTDKDFRNNVHNIRETLNHLANVKLKNFKPMSFDQLKAKFDSERGENFECPYNEHTCNL
jgi:chromosomal replication initiation ATPase DnaA